MRGGYSVVIDLSGDEIFFVSTGEGQLYAFPSHCQELQGTPTLKNRTSFYIHKQEIFYLDKVKKQTSHILYWHLFHAKKIENARIILDFDITSLSNKVSLPVSVYN
jgi:hypothetical protein